jgi:CRISPR-associated protein Cmr3
MKTKYGFAVKLNDEFDMLPSTGYLILGGEAKAAKYTRLQSDIPFSFGLAESKKRFKVVLITPAFFSSGWEPDAGNWSDVLGFPAKIIAASLGKPLYLGGYDVANHRQRAIQSFVAPGSVYYFETSEPIRQLKRPFTESPSPEMPLERLGYGQAFLGHWDWQSLQEVK